MAKTFSILISFFIFLGCSNQEQPKNDQEVLPRVGVYIDYQWTTKVKDYEVRKERLKLFLDEYDVNEGEWEDSVHIRYVRYAKYNLLQCYYHLGELNEADKLLKVIVESDLEIK